MVVKGADSHRQHSETLGLLFREEVSEFRAGVYIFLFMILDVGMFDKGIDRN